MIRHLLGFAASAALVASSASSQNLHTHILDRGQVLPGGDVVRWIDRFLPNAGGAGWAAMLTVDPGARREIWADFVDDGSSVPQRLYALPLGANDYVQNLSLHDVRNGSVIWEMVQGVAGQSPEYGVWIDGAWEPQAQGAGPLPGSTWFDTPKLRRTTDGALVAFGTVNTATSGSRKLLMELGASAPMLIDGQAIAGTNVTMFLNDPFLVPNSLDLSPDGEHVIAFVGGSDSQQWLILDGAPLTLHGATLRKSNPAPQEVLDALGVSTAWFHGFRNVGVRDSGEWTAVAVIGMPLNQYEYVAIRSGRLIDTGGEPVFGVSFVKGATAVVNSPEKTFTDHAVLTRVGDPVDLDRDGLADPGWEVSIMGTPFPENGAGQVYSGTYLENATGDSRGGYMRLPNRMPELPVCEGVPNSSGLVGRLSAVGSADALAGDLTLIAHGLPENAAGYTLVSADRGLVVQPGGSQGNLCLTGAIGRYTGSVIQSGPLGAGPTSIDLSAIPQPLGQVTGAAGQVWFFQLWYRDQISGASTSNFTDAIAVQIR